MNKLLCVIGMHRSGTSATAGVLSHLGVNFGRDLMPPSNANPKGYFEAMPVVKAHDRIMRQMGARWSSSKPFPADWTKKPYLFAAVQFLHGWYERNKFDDDSGTLPGVKDPRMCRLLPLWQSFAESRSLELVPVLVFREREAVIASLVRREGWSPITAGRLVDTYDRGMDEWSELEGAVAVSFEGLMKDAVGELEDIDYLPADGPDEWQRAVEFLDPKLVHFGA